jgi:hypothetical protein
VNALSQKTRLGPYGAIVVFLTSSIFFYIARQVNVENVGKRDTFKPEWRDGTRFA